MSIHYKMLLLELLLSLISNCTIGDLGDYAEFVHLDCLKPKIAINYST